VFEKETQKLFIYLIMSEEIQLVNQPEDIDDEIDTLNDNDDKNVGHHDTTKFINEIEIIQSQSGIDDKLLIERTFMECNNDITKTILKLMNLLPQEVHKEPTDIDIFREILNEKDRIYHDVMDKNKQ
jgi:hypothetical protein